MIKEAYCSFEVAKLLKEKGFNEPCRTYYEENKLINDVCVKYNQWNSKSPFGFISAPTHQMAMAWLREKEIQISIEWCVNGYYGYIINNNDEGSTYILDTKDSYGEAVEAALKYSLENLI